MLRLIGFELSKIFRRKSNIAAMLSGLLLFGIVSFCRIAQTSIYIPEKDEYIDGLEAFEFENRMNEQFGSELTPELIETQLQELSDKGFEISENDSSGWDLIAQKSRFWWVVVTNITPVGCDAHWESLNNLPPEEGRQFYSHRMENISDYLRSEQRWGHYSSEEQAYWLKMAEKSNSPYQWGGTFSICTLKEIVEELLPWCMFFILFVVASVFSSEYETGGAELLQTTMRGQRCLCRAKIIASLIFAISYQCIVTLLCCGAIAATVGIHGTGLPLQIKNSLIPYNFTMGDAIILTAVIDTIITAGTVCLVLVFSEKTRSSIVALALAVSVVLVPAYFPDNSPSRLLNHVFCLLPIKASSSENLFQYMSFQAGGIVMSYIQMIVIVYIIAAAAASFLLVRTTRK